MLQTSKCAHSSASRRENSMGSSIKPSSIATPGVHHRRLQPVMLCIGAAWLTSAAIAADSTPSAGSGAQLEEVIVTAQKRSERLQDVPVPVTALDADTLAARNQVQLQDYFAEVPGLNLSSSGNGQMSLSIRGLTAGTIAGGSPTVGVTIDDVPRGFNTAPGFSANLYEDLDPGDLERVEVLRGPQGALYGAASIGGLIKFVTKDPSTAGVNGRAQLIVNDTEGKVGFGARASVNLPAGESFAIRASAFTRRDPGYIDNVTTGERDVNDVKVKGGRISALWKPSEHLSLKLSAMLQDTDGDGSSEVDLQRGDLQQGRMRGTEGYSQKTALYSAILNAGFAGLNLTSISAYGTYKYRHLSDQSGFYGGYAQDLFGVGGASLLDTIDPKKFSQEVRLASAANQKLEWLVGAFYTHEKTPAHQSLLANDPVTGAVAGSQVEIDFPTSFTEQALFGYLTGHVSDQFSLQVGGRASTNRQTYDELDDGPLFGGTFVTPTTHTKASANTWLLTPQYKFSPDLMAYARFASGYRAGGPNANVPGNSTAPKSYEPDKDNSFDIGIKGELLDRRLSFDAALYYIDWKNVQIAVIDQATQFLIHTNGGNAKSQGLELALQARPANGLTIAASATFGDAKLKEALPAISTAIAAAGERLPFSSRFASSFSLDQEFALAGSWKASAGGSLHFVGERKADFISGAGATRSTLPAYTALDLRADARSDGWTLGLFVNNASNKRGFIGRTEGGPANPAPTGIFIRPRTFGLSVTKEF
jgi:outer membrane receptor protein involved in Fe transport